MAQIITVLGMHRSGTSALAEVLVAAGAWFGGHGVAAGAMPLRPLGLVERKDFLGLSKAALAAQECNWHDISAFERNWGQPAYAKLRQSFSTTVLADLTRHDLSVLKDPRLCLLLPLFRPAMPDTFAVMIVRHPVEVAASLNARNALPIPAGVALWEAYNRHAMLSLQGIPSILVHHRRLMQRPEGCITGMLAALTELGVSGLNPGAAVEAKSIRQGAYRQRTSQVAFRKIAKSQREFWAALRQAKSLADIPIGEISEESCRALERHHAAPIVRQMAAHVSTNS